MKPLGCRRRRPRADAGVVLPTELVLEILERASPSVVVRCAATCKPWLRLVSRRSFVRRASRPRRALLLGFFVFDHADHDEQAMLRPRFVPRPGGPAGWRCPCSPGLDPRCLDLDPVLSRNGYLVLSRVTLAKPGAGMPTAINYCVCNPATGSCYFLPPYYVNKDVGFWECTCALLTGRDLSSSSFELVVAAIQTEQQELLISIFSSHTMQWSSQRSLEIPPFFIDSERARYYGPGYSLGRPWTYLEMHPRTPPAVCGSSICWLCTCDCTERVILALDVRGPMCDVVNLLDLPNESRSQHGPYRDFGILLGCRDDGQLRAFTLAERYLTLTMWAWLSTRRGNNDIPMWCPTGDIDLRMAVSAALGSSSANDSDDMGVKLLWYCDKSNVLVFTTAAFGYFALDLDTKSAEPLGNILQCKSECCARYDCISWRACPYEMECPSHWITPK